MMGAELELQNALVDVLSTNATIVALTGGRVFDWPTPEAVYPFVTVGDITSEIDDTDTRERLSLQFILHTWARGPGSRAVARQIGEAARGILHRLPDALALDNFDTRNLVFEGGTVEYEGTGSTVTTAFVSHGIYRFRMIASPN